MRYGWVVAALALGLGGCVYAGDGYYDDDTDTGTSSGDYHDNDRDGRRHHDGHNRDDGHRGGRHDGGGHGGGGDHRDGGDHDRGRGDHKGDHHGDRKD